MSRYTGTGKPQYHSRHKVDISDEMWLEAMKFFLILTKLREKRCGKASIKFLPLRKAWDTLSNIKLVVKE